LNTNAGRSRRQWRFQQQLTCRAMSDRGIDDEAAGYEQLHPATCFKFSAPYDWARELLSPQVHVPNSIQTDYYLCRSRNKQTPLP
jgi:hypothetical protein